MAVATVPPYPLDGPAPVVGGREHGMWDVLAPCRLISLFGIPAASVPFGASADGLPIGLMVTGPLYEDLGVLQACRAYEEAAGPIWPSPELSGCLDRIAGPADTAVNAKIWANRSL